MKYIQPGLIKMDFYFWTDYGDEGKIKYAVYATLGFAGLVEHFEGKRKQPARKGDFHMTFNQHYLISQKMVDIMGEILKKYGTLKKKKVKDRKDPLYHFVLTNELDCIDYSKSTYYSMSYYKSKPPFSEVAKPVLDIQKYDGSMIFTVPNQDSFYPFYFVTEEFIETIRKHSLKGFKFYRCPPLVTSAADIECNKKYFFG